MLDRSFIRSTTFLLLLLLAACSQQPTVKPTSSDVKAATSNAIPQQWNINAKLGIRTEEDSGSVILQWQQQDDEYHIRVSGPLGQGNSLITGNTHSITIAQPNKENIHSNQPSQLMKDNFGWALPLAQFQYWARGLSHPNSETTQLEHNELGRLSSLTQSGWSLSYSRYKLVDSWWMPHRIRATKGDVTITLIVRQWAFTK